MNEKVKVALLLGLYVLAIEPYSSPAGLSEVLGIISVGILTLISIVMVLEKKDA